MTTVFGAHSVPPAKVRDYLLDAANPANDGKAAFYERFGFRRDAWQILQAALYRHPLEHPVKRVEATGYGRKLIVECAIEAPDGRTPCIRSVWIMRGDDPAQLVTAYPG